MSCSPNECPQNVTKPWRPADPTGWLDEYTVGRDDGADLEQLMAAVLEYDAYKPPVADDRHVDVDDWRH